MKLVLAGALALVLKLILAASTAGTNDARTWEYDLTTLRTAGFAELYRSGVQYDSPDGRLSQRQAFIHPPAVLHVLGLLGNHFRLRAACAIADVGTLVLLWRMFGSRPQVLVLALSPISILISGFHGNTDPIMMFFLVGAVFFAERGSTGHAGTASGIAFGLACSVKLVPLIFAPAILLYLPGLRPRLRWLAASLVVWIALSLPYLAQEPVLILRTMLGYSGATGLWGLSLASTVLGANHFYIPGAKWIALLAAACLPIVTMKRSLFAQCGLIAFCFLLLSPGFGLQYLAWTLPWTVLLDRRLMIGHHLLVGAAALAAYAAASQITPMGIYADLLNPAHFSVLIPMGIVCWIAIAVSMATLWAVRNPALPTRPGDPGSTATVPDC